MWLTDLGITFDWIDAATEIGGTLRRVGNPIRNYAGVIAADGPTLVKAISESLQHLAIRPRFGVSLNSVEQTAAGIIAQLNGEAVRYDAVIVALGTRPRLLGLANEGEFMGRGVEISVTRSLPRYRDREVCVVGGGDAALEGCLLLADVSPIVHLVHRRTEFRGQKRFVDAVQANERIVIHNAEVSAIHAGDAITGVSLSTGKELAVSGVFVRIGVQPVCPEGLTPDPRGYIQIDSGFRTSLPGVYACGDAAAPVHQSASWAAGSAAAAVRTLMDEL